MADARVWPCPVDKKARKQAPPPPPPLPQRKRKDT